MTALYDTVSTANETTGATDPTGAIAPTETMNRLRVVLMLDVYDGQEERFLAAYEQIRHQVAGVPGHISDQLCQSLGNSSQWLITSEWEGAEPFLTWVESQAHRELVEPLHGCVSDTTSLRYLIARETPDPALTGIEKKPQAKAGKPKGDPIPAPPLSVGGVVRHALTFTVKPGTEREVAKILAGYRSPKAQVDERTRLCRTSLFMLGNRVVRSVEVTGDLGNALRHVAAQPEVRAVEEAVNPHLEEARDFADPSSVRAFFAKAALPAAHHNGTHGSGAMTRLAFCYPVRPGCGVAAASLLAEHDKAAVLDATKPLAGCTMFLRDDILIRMVDLREPFPKAPAAAAGIAHSGAARELTRLLDLGAGADLTTKHGIAAFLSDCAMELITDRSSQDS